MKIYRETDCAILEEPDYRTDFFKFEVETPDGDFNLHSYFIQNRNTIFGQFIYLLHEVALSIESTIDFIGFTESGAVLLIEVKRGADTRNRQEVISQLVKYALDAHSISNIISDEEQFANDLNDKRLLNKPFDKSLLAKIKTNIQNGNLNLFLVTEDATDEVIASIYYLSYGRKNQKISVIELKRYIIDNQKYCIVRQFNKQSLLGTTRKEEYPLEAKLDLIEDSSIRFEIKRQIEKWFETGFTAASRSISTPEYFTFEWKKGQSIWVYYYVLDKQHKVLSGKVKNNSIAIYVDVSDLQKYQKIIGWVKSQRNNYFLKSNNKGKSRDYHLYCIDIFDYESDEIDRIFDKIREIAIMKRGEYFTK